MSEIITKKCPKCGIVKEKSEYYIRKNGNFQDCCKKCYNIRGSEYQRREKEAVNARARKRYKKNPEKYKKQSREWYEAHPGVKTKVNKN